MVFKTILVDCDADEAVVHRLKLAVALTDRFAAHLIAQHARPPFVAPTLATILLAFAAGQAQAGTWRHVEGWVISSCPKKGGQCVDQGSLPWPTYGDCNAALTAALRTSAPQTTFSCKYVNRQQFFQ